MNKRISFLFCAALMLAALPALSVQSTERTAPNCQLTSLTDGKRLNLQSFRGKVLYVDFWASWCGPCAESFPFMNQIDQDLRERGLQVLAVNLDEMASDAQKFLAEHPANFTIGADPENQCAQAFGVNAMPTSYLIDRNGVIRYEHMGFRSGEAQEFKALAEKLLAEKPAGQ